MAATNSAKSNTGSRSTGSSAGKAGAKGNATGSRSSSGSKSAGGSKSGSRSGSGSRSRTTGGTRSAGNRRATAQHKPLSDRIINDDDEKALSPERHREISFFIYLAVSIFLLCSNFGICGAFGNVISGFFFGLLGWAQYLIPFYLFFAAAFLLSNGPKKSIIRKLIWIGVVLVMTSWVFQLTYGAEGQTAGTIYMAGYSEHRGGGVIFGGIMVLLYQLIGKVGIIILTILLSIVAVIQITGVSLINLVKGIFAFEYPEGEYEDPDEEYHDRKPVRSRARRPNMLAGLKVLPEDRDEDGKEELRKKSGRRSGAGKDRDTKEALPADEMTEIIPDPYHDDMEELKEAARRKVESDLAMERQRKKKAGKTESREPAVMPVTPDRGLVLPGQERTVYPEEWDDQGAETAFYEKTDPAGGKDTPAKKPDGPVDFFDLKPEHEDPLGEDWSGVSYDPEKDSAFETVTRSAENQVPEKVVPKSGIPEEYDPEPVYETRRPDAETGKVSRVPEAPAAMQTQGGNEKKVSHSDTLREMEEISQSLAEQPEKPKKKPYRLPPVSLLTPIKNKDHKGDADVRETAVKLKKTMESFGVNVTITDYSRGPAVTRYELTPEVGVKVSKILSLQDDIKLNLAAADIRIEAPIPGKAAIGIEVPNKEKQMISFRELIDSDAFRNARSKLSFAIGKDIGGQTIIGDIAKMPHILIAGSTGSGKSVCINTIIMSILYKAKPEEVRMIMIDPKMVELTAYNGIPHMLIPVVTDPKKAAGALNWAVQEMEKRYMLFARHNVRNLEGFNKKVEDEGPFDPEDLEHADLRFLPQIVVIVDELADLMMVAHGEVEDAIVRLSQLARAAGIHLVIATQRPSVDVITGLIKANVPSRIAFAVSSGTDSRTILDMVGAEKLLGKGDMLYYPTGNPKPVRVQGAFVSDEEVMSVTDFIRKQCGDAEYDENVAQSVETGAVIGSSPAAQAEEDERYDEYFEEAGRLVIEKDKASIGYLQRVFRIGFNRAARIMDQLADAGVVGQEEGTKPRKVLMTMDEFESFMQN